MPIVMEIVRDIKQRLMDSGAFAGVFLSGLPENFGFGASVLNAAVIEPPPGRGRPNWDGGAATVMVTNERVTVTLMARNNDPELRDEAALNLVQVLKDCVNGHSLAAMTVPDHTYVESWTPLPERHPERRYRCVVAVEYLAEDFGRSVPT